MAILVVAEHDNANLKDATHKTVTAAAAMGGDVDVLVAGKGVKDVSAQAAKIAGVRKVLMCDHISLKRQLAESMEVVLVPLMDGYDAILAPDTTTHKNYMPRIAAKLDVQQISSVTGVESADTFVRPIYAGNAMATVQSSDAKKCVTVRTTAFAAAGEGGSAAVETIADPKGRSNRNMSAKNSRNLTALNLQLRKSSFLADAAWAAARTSNSSKELRISSAQQWAPLAPQLMRALFPMIGKSAKQAKPLRPSFTSQLVFLARFSIWPV